jgi:hypothetical protein
MAVEAVDRAMAVVTLLVKMEDRVVEVTAGLVHTVEDRLPKAQELPLPIMELQAGQALIAHRVAVAVVLALDVLHQWVAQEKYGS